LVLVSIIYGTVEMVIVVGTSTVWILVLAISWFLVKGPISSLNQVS